MGNIAEMAGVGFEIEHAKSIIGSKDLTVSAAGTVQGDATSLTAATNLVTTVAAGAGVIPVSTFPDDSEMRIFNGGANSLLVYPTSGGAINGGSSNTAVTLAQGEGLVLARLSSTVWAAVGISGTDAVFLDQAQTFSAVQSFSTAAGNALVAGSGASGSEHELGSTAGTALDFRFRGSHTTGDMRGMYLRLDMDAAAVSAHGGEALRALTEIENVDVAVGGTVNGAHITLEIDGNSGTVDGAGNALRATLGGSGTKTNTGTLSGVLVDLDLPSAVTLAGTEAAIRIGKAQDHEWPVAIAFDNTVGSGNAIAASDNAISGNASHAIHITIDGVSHYIAAWDNASFS